MPFSKVRSMLPGSLGGAALTTPHQYHTAIIGGGAAGLTVAVGLARLGISVLLIEKERLGGECTHTGCIPSKALLYAAEAVAAGEIEPTAALEYARAKRAAIYAEETPEKLEAEGVALMHGVARFLDAHRLAVTTAERDEEVEVYADHIVIATGSQPRMLSLGDIDGINGIDSTKIHTNQTIFELDTPPKQLAIIGGGPIGCEMATAFAQLGTKVTLLQRGGQLLKQEAPEVSERVKLSLESLGVDVQLETDSIDEDGRPQQVLVAADAILFAIGRVPALESLELDAADVSHSRRGIAVNDVYQTNQDHIYAIGDCNTAPNFTHLANQQGRIVVQDMAIPLLPAQEPGPLPWVTYLQPEIATVGKSLQALRQLPAHAWQRRFVSLDETDRGVTAASAGNFILVWHERFSGKILRATIVAPHAGEMLPIYALAMQEGVSLWRFFRLMWAYPTTAAAMRTLADAFVYETLRALPTELYWYVRIRLSQFLRAHGRALGAALFWIATIAGFTWYLRATGQDATQFGAVLRMAFEQPYIGAFIYITIYFLRPLVLFPAGILSIAAGLIYGLPLGAALSLIGGTLSAVIPYWFGRVFRSDEHDDAVDAGLRARSGWNRRLRFIDERPFQTTLAGRLLFLPYDLVSVVAGTLGAGFIPFLLATAIGNVPGSIMFAAFGSSVQNLEQGLQAATLDWRMVTLSGVLLVTSIGIQKIVERVFQRHEE